MVETNIYINREIIPVNPTKWSYKVRGDNTNHILLGVGEISIPRIPKLATFGWSSFFPGDYSHPYVNPNAAVMRPAEWKDAILGLLNGREIIDLVVTRENTGDYASIPVVIDSFNYEERGGETGDLYYDISFSQYREYQPNQAVVVGFDDPDSSIEVEYNYDGESVTLAEFYTNRAKEDYVDAYATRNFSGTFYVYDEKAEDPNDPYQFKDPIGGYNILYAKENKTSDYSGQFKVTAINKGQYRVITSEDYGMSPENAGTVSGLVMVKIEYYPDTKTYYYDPIIGAGNSYSYNYVGYITEKDAEAIGINLDYIGKDDN